MIFTFDNKLYSEQPPPDRETLYLAANEVSEYCESLSRDIRKLKNISSHKNVKRFYSDCFTALSTKIHAIIRLGSTFRNEVNSLSRDLTEIIIDGAWIWYYFEFEKNEKLAEMLCKQFYYNAKAHFISEFALLKSLYLNSPFIKGYYSKEKLKKYKTDFQQTIGSYKYQQNWRKIPQRIELKQYKWNARCDKAAVVMEKYANLIHSNLYRNLSLLSAYSHWDSLQIEMADEKLEEATFNSNLNAHIGLIHDMINLGYYIIKQPISNDLRLLRHRIIW